MILYGRTDHHQSLKTKSWQSSFNHLLRSTKTFSWKYFATRHGKGVVDGIGGVAKALVWAKVMSKEDDRIIVQLPTDFSKAAEQLLKKTEMIHNSQQEISSRILEVIDWRDYSCNKQWVSGIKLLVQC